MALKRKFIYKENVMEEIVDKDKVKKYFEYFEMVNPLFFIKSWMREGLMT